jgi:hypothetical protein
MCDKYLVVMMSAQAYDSGMNLHHPVAARKEKLAQHRIQQEARRVVGGILLKGQEVQRESLGIVIGRKPETIGHARFQEAVGNAALAWLQAHSVKDWSIDIEASKAHSMEPGGYGGYGNEKIMRWKDSLSLVVRRTVTAEVALPARANLRAVPDLVAEESNVIQFPLSEPGPTRPLAA